MLLGVSSQRAGLTHMLFLGHIITLMIYKLRLGFMVIDAGDVFGSGEKI
jgi:hypothetical protein